MGFTIFICDEKAARRGSHRMGELEWKTVTGKVRNGEYMKSTKIIFCPMLMLMFLMAACASGNRNTGAYDGSNITPAIKTESSQENATSEATGQEMTGILMGVDTEKKAVLIQELKEGVLYECLYTGGSDVRNAYGSVVPIETIDIGSMVDVVYNAKSAKILSMVISEAAFINSGVTNIDIDVTNRTIRIGSGLYQYDDNLVVMSQGKKIELSEIVSKDVLTIMGCDKKIYSIIVDKGHGYINLTGCDIFEGGTVSVGRSQLLTITENMLITAPEGEYKITVTRGKEEASKTVTIVRDEEITVDFSEYRSEVVQSGKIEFTIKPEGAILYINGKETDYSELVELDYGKYTITVFADGYDTYSDTLKVNATYMTKTIDVTGESATDGYVTNANGETVPSGGTSTENGTSSSSEMGTTSASNQESTTGAVTGTGKGNLIIEAPEGAQLYIDSVYIGVVPVTIAKLPGEHTITFKKEGYTTKSYSIDISMEDGDQKMAFPDMNIE